MIPVDYRQLLNAADQLVTTEDDISRCPECFPDNWCFAHAQQHGKIMSELRTAIGRPLTLYKREERKLTINQDRRQQLLDLVQEYSNRLRQETEPMTHYERSFFLDTFVRAIGVALSCFQKAVANGHGDEV